MILMLMKNQWDNKKKENRTWKIKIFYKLKFNKKFLIYKEIINVTLKN